MADPTPTNTVPPALKTSGLTLPRDVAAAIIKGARNASTVAILSGKEPMIYADHGYMVFSESGEAQVLGEGAAQTSTAHTPTSVTATKYRVTTTQRVTEESLYADEDSRLNIVNSIQTLQAEAIGRAIDYIVYHGVNPATGTALTGFTGIVGASGAKTVTATADAVADFDSLVGKVIDDFDVNGIAMARGFANDLRVARTKNGTRLYPEIPLTLAPGQIEGINAATSNTVNGKALTTASKVKAILGDFSLIKYGIMRDVTTEVIAYGNPDGGASDLKATGEVALRTTAEIAVAILDPLAFAILKSAA